MHGALAHLKALLNLGGRRRDKAEAKPSYQWAIEGDIKGCFDHIGHHPLMVRVRRRIGDGKLNRLVFAFLKAGVMDESQFIRSDSGSPQGGILSPLLSNVALSIIEERYERHVWPRAGTSRSGKYPTRSLTDPTLIARRACNNRGTDKRRGLPVFIPIRYADDFVILVSSPGSDPEQGRVLAEQEKSKLAEMLKTQMSLTLSPEKTLVTPVTGTMRFLGHHLRVRRHPTHRRLHPRLVIPKDRSQRLRRIIKLNFDPSTAIETLESRLRWVNPIVRGWGNFYRYAWGAKRVFADIDRYVWWTVWRWLRRKHPDTKHRQLALQYGWRKPRQRGWRWRDGVTTLVPLSTIRVAPYYPGRDRGPHYA